MRTSRLLPSAWALIVAAACGDGGGSGNTASTGPQNLPPPATVAVFSAVPVDVPSYGSLTPLGHIQPVGHVLPTDHVYFYPVDIDRPFVRDSIMREVRAPGDGVVTWVLNVSTGTIADSKIMFRMTPTFYYYLDHVVLDPAIKVGTVVRAGQRIGQTTPGGTLDLGAYDMAITLPGLLVPARYPDQTLHCVSPWKYFTEPLRSQLYARLRRDPSAPDRDGRIDYDVPGRLVGNWFHESVPKSHEASGPSGWPKSLAFAYDFKDPSSVRISIGGTVANPGVWRVASDAPRPETITPASGKVRYALLYRDADVAWGHMLVEMIAPDRIRVQVAQGSSATLDDFGPAAQVYVR